MADASALPTDDALQPGQTGASLQSPLAEGETPGEPVALAEPGAPQATPADPAPAPGLASPDPSEPQADPAQPGPELAFEAVSEPPEPSPEPTPEPTPDPTSDPTPDPVPAGPAAESAGANWAAAIASEPVAAPPEPAPLPKPEVLPLTPPPVPTVATTIDLPARGGNAGAGPTGEGGEWALLLSKLQAWLGSGQLQDQLQAARTPLTLVAGLIALLVVLQIYGALLAVIRSFPLAPGLLELVGVIAVVRFGLDKLVRSQERRALIEGLQRRWQAFQGKA